MPKSNKIEISFDVFPEYIISEGGREAFSQNIQGMIAGADLAERYGWKIGDRIPIIGDIWKAKAKYNLKYINILEYFRLLKCSRLFLLTVCLLFNPLTVQMTWIKATG